MSTASDIMTKKAVVIEETISATEIAKIMDRNKVSCIIITKNGLPYGIVTERDFVSKLVALNKRPSDLSASEIMSSPVTIVSSYASVDEVAQKMLEKKIKHVVVVDQGQPTGIITVTDFVKHLNTIITDDKDHKRSLYNELFDEYEFWYS